MKKKINKKINKKRGKTLLERPSLNFLFSRSENACRELQFAMRKASRARFSQQIACNLLSILLGFCRSKN